MVAIPSEVVGVTVLEFRNSLQGFETNSSKVQVQLHFYKEEGSETATPSTAPFKTDASSAPSISGPAVANTSKKSGSGIDYFAGENDDDDFDFDYGEDEDDTDEAAEPIFS